MTTTSTKITSSNKIAVPIDQNLTLDANIIWEDKKNISVDGIKAFEIKKGVISKTYDSPFLVSVKSNPDYINLMQKLRDSFVSQYLSIAYDIRSGGKWNQLRNTEDFSLEPSLNLGNTTQMSIAEEKANDIFTEYQNTIEDMIGKISLQVSYVFLNQKASGEWSAELSGQYDNYEILLLHGFYSNSSLNNVGVFTPVIVKQMIRFLESSASTSKSMPVAFYGKQTPKVSAWDPKILDKLPTIGIKLILDELDP